MARIYEPIPDEDLKGVTAANLRKEYSKLSGQFKKIINRDFMLCFKCNEFLSSDMFYLDLSYASGKFPICKRCILAMVEQRQNKNDTPNETPESVQKVLQMMDLPYIDSFYRDCCKGSLDAANEKNRKAPFSTYITSMKSLPNWKGLTWKDSDFGLTGNSAAEDEMKMYQKTIKAGKKRFGPGYSDSEYNQLENHYQSWISRYECNTKAQEEVFESIAILKVQKQNAIKQGKQIKDIKEIDNLIQSWLDTGNLKPKQNTTEALNDSLTFGQLIEKWEEEEPIPEPIEEFKDVDGIGKYIRIWFKGHLARALGIDNGYSKEYDEYIKNYTVSKPELQEDGKSETIYNTLFGSGGE